MTEELNRRHNLATTPTINNNGESYIVPFDIYKEGYDAYDISNWFKGRVGDNGTPFGIRWYKHGQLMDVTGMRPFIEGQVGDYTIDDSDPDDPKINMDSEASNVHVVGDVNDCQEYGVAIYRLINQAMPQSGIFYGKIGVMGTQDDGTTVMSSVDVVFKVLAGHMNMMGARKFYVSELEKAWLDLQAIIKQYNQEYKDATTKQAEQFKSDTEKALADLNTKIANEIKRAEDTLGDTQASIDSNIASLKRIAATCGSIQAQIDANDIVKLSDFKDQTNALANGQKNLTSTITSKLATLSAQPELFNSSGDIKAKYPNGSTGVKIATDTWHGWGYINDSWKDLGDYKPTSVPPVQLANASTAYLDEGNQISFRKLNDGNTAFKLPKGVNIIGNSAAVKLDDIKAAAVSSNNVKYEDGEFVGNTFLCIYHPSTKTVSFESSYANTNPEDLILFGVMWNSWIGGVLIQDSYNNRVENSARPWYGYLYGRDPLLEFSEVLGKSVTLSLDFNITIYGNQNHVDLTKEKITSDIKEQLKTAPFQGIFYDEKTYKLTSDEFSLIYDFSDQKVKVIHKGLPTLTSTQVNLFSDYFGNGSMQGIAYEDYLKRSVENSARPWYGYLYGRTPLLEFSEDSGKSVTLSLDFNITIYGNQKYVDLTKEKITSDIKEQLKTAPVEGIAYDENDFKLSSDEFSLIYDFEDQKVKVFHKAFLSLTSTQVNLFSDYFGNGSIQGIAYEDYLKRKRTIPEYWQTELNQKIAEIQNNVGKIENGLSFLWITDIHWENNDGLSPMLIKQLVSRTNISYMIDGGDHFNSGSTIEEAINKLSEGYSNLTIPGIDHIGVVGNHDDNKMLWPRDPAKVLQNYQIFNAMFPHTLHSVDLKMTNYPVDLSWELKFNQNPELINHKYQYAAFGFDGRLDASKDQILKFVEFCKNPYKILAFTHGILDYGNWLQWGTDLGKIIDAINNKDTNVSTESYGVIDLKGVQAKVVALVSGHEHQDNVKYTAGGTPLIVTDSDCGIQTYKNTKYPYKKGTITEQSFSVFSIDLDNSKIYEVKVGRGEDREFNIPEICKDDPQLTQPASGTEPAKSEPAKQDETKPATPQIQPAKQDTGENSPKSAEPQAQPTEQNKDSDKQ